MNILSKPIEKRGARLLCRIRNFFLEPALVALSPATTTGHLASAMHLSSGKKRLHAKRKLLRCKMHVKLPQGRNPMDSLPSPQLRPGLCLVTSSKRTIILESQLWTTAFFLKQPPIDKMPSLSLSYSRPTCTLSISVLPKPFPLKLFLFPICCMKSSKTKDSRTRIRAASTPGRWLPIQMHQRGHGRKA